jgi:hypothetical protein
VKRLKKHDHTDDGEQIEKCREEKERNTENIEKF